MASFRILHLSDLHERVALPFMSDSRKRLIEVQKVRRHRVLGAEFRRVLTEIVSERRPDVIVFTGDLADWGLDEEYQRAEARLNEILSLVGISVDRLFLVPGNHDINRTECVDHWKEVRGLVGENLQGVSEWLVGLRAPRGAPVSALDMIAKRQGPFRRFLDRMQLNHQRPENGRHGQLGYRSELRLSDRHAVHVIGLDTAWLAGDDADAGRLALTDHQIDMHTTDRDGHDFAGFRLALMHHPLHYLADHADAARLLADRVDLVLYGHQHHAAALDASDPDRHLQTLAAGSVFEGDQGDRWVNGFNVIDVELDDDSRPIHYDVGFWAWSANGHWHRHSALYKHAPHGRIRWHVMSRGRTLPSPLPAQSLITPAAKPQHNQGAQAAPSLAGPAAQAPSILPSGSLVPLTRLQRALSQQLERLPEDGTADERHVVQQMLQAGRKTNVIEWLHEPEGGLEIVELLRSVAQEQWSRRRLDDQAVRLISLLILVGAESRLLESFKAAGINQAGLSLAVDNETSAAVLGLCLLDRGVHFEIDFNSGLIRPRNVVLDLEPRVPGVDAPHQAIRRAIGSVERSIIGRRPGDSLISLRAMEKRLQILDERKGIRLIVAIPHGDPAGVLAEPGTPALLAKFEIPTVFFRADHASASCDPQLLAEIESDLRSQVNDVLSSVGSAHDGGGSEIPIDRPLVFFSYSHHADDARWNQHLLDQLRALEGRGKIKLWVDEREIAVGDRWNEEIQGAIERASVAVLMISKHFMNSGYIKEKELPPLRRRERRGELRFVPVLLGACGWKHDAELSSLQFAAGTLPLNTITDAGALDVATNKIAEQVLEK